MDLFLKPALSRNTNADHLAFHRQLHFIIKRHEGLIDTPEYIVAYGEAVKQEELVYAYIRKSKSTVKLSDAVRERNEFHSLIKMLVQINRKHALPEYRRAADRMDYLLKHYDKTISKGIGARTFSFDMMIRSLRGTENQVNVTLLGLLPWLDRLDELNNKLKEYEEAIMSDKINRPKLTTKESRSALDAKLRMITGRFEMLTFLNGPDAYRLFINEYNIIVRRYNKLIEKRQPVRMDIGTGMIARIPPQLHTGGHVTPIPEIRMKVADGKGGETVVDLRFTVDFQPTYLDNVRPGNAMVIAHGIGKYKGLLKMMFHIEAQDAQETQDA
jgi:hypothetical protein